jgi:thiol-disulfide isomerase/thioredoxin
MKSLNRLLLMLMLVAIAAPGVLAGGGRERDGADENPAEASAQGAESAAEDSDASAAGELTPLDAETAAILNSLGLLPFRNRIPAEDFILPVLGGGTMSLSEHEGSVVFLNFWATWCPPCREEMPSMQLLYEELSDEGLVMLAVDALEPEETVAAFIEELGFTFPVLLDRRGDVNTRYSVQALPTTYILDREGNVIGMRPGFHDWSTPEMLENFRALLEL